MGVPETDWAPLYSGQVEAFLMPILFRQTVLLNEHAVLAEIRGELTKLYCEFSDTVLTFMMRTYRRNGAEAQKRVAEEAGERFVGPPI